MSDNWSIIKEEVHTYRNYVKHLPADAAKQAFYSYLLSKEEFERLLSLKGDGQQLDGVRIYVGAKMIDGHIVPTVHVVACIKEDGQYNDYNVPSDLPHVAMAAETGVKPLAFAAAATTTDGGDGSTGKLPPCPDLCGKQNILNS